MAEKYIPLSAAVDEMKSWEQENKSYHPEDYEDEEQEEPGIPVLEVIERLNSIEPADVRPVVHGEWVEIKRKDVNPLTGRSGVYVGCSKCGCPIPTDNALDFIDESEVNICYNCGADMRPEPPEREVGA